MKLKFPKKIAIGDSYFEIKVDKKRIGGEFYYWDDDKNKLVNGAIIIGTKLLKIQPETVLTTIIHELKEIIQNEQSVRFGCPSQKDTYEFHYDHKEHADLCSRLAMALSQFIE